MTAVETLREALCSSFCKDVAVVERADGYAIGVPMARRDGDYLTAYVSEEAGGWKVSDKGSTLMRLSYENDLDKLLTGAREKLFTTVLAESGLQEDDGEIFIKVPADGLQKGLFALGQGTIRVEDLGLWTRSRIESTFYDDLGGILQQVAGAERITEGYTVPNVPDGPNYPVDYFVQTPGRPLYVFGVLNKDKARLTTIILQHLAKHAKNFDSMVVYADVDEIPKQDQKRLMSAANDAVPSISDLNVIETKIRHRLEA